MNKARPPRETWTFEPDEITKSLMRKAMNRHAGKDANKRGLRTKLLNEAVCKFYASLAGKREAAVGVIVILLGLWVFGETRPHNSPPPSFAPAAFAMGQTN